MIGIDEDILDSWKSPPEGFKDDNETEEDSLKFGVSCIDKFISSIGHKETLSIIGSTV